MWTLIEIVGDKTEGTRYWLRVGIISRVVGVVVREGRQSTTDIGRS
jgi:hypothetical protein